MPNSKHYAWLLFARTVVIFVFEKIMFENSNYGVFMRKSFVFALLFGMAFFGMPKNCLAAETASETQTVAAQENVSQDAEVIMPVDGQEVQVSKGFQLKVSLEGNITTGFDWEIEDFKPSLLEVTESVYADAAQNQENPGTPVKVGAGGVKTFTFRAKKAGETRLVFWYKRPWSEDEPEKAIVLNVKIK